MSRLLSITETPEVHLESVGNIGERLAARHLRRLGFRIVATNFRVPVGRNRRGATVTGEIDIIALDGETLCFVEVKSRRSEDFAPITRNVDLQKQRQIVRTAKVYRRMFALADVKVRYDVVTVLLPQHARAKIELLKGYFSEAALRKRKWSDSFW
jgi:putative endonuclease